MGRVKAMLINDNAIASMDIALPILCVGDATAEVLELSGNIM